MSARTDLIGRAIASISRFNAAGWARTKCPLCEQKVGSRDKRGSFAFNGQSHVWMCFRCGVKGKWSGAMPRAHVPQAPLAPVDAVLGPPDGFAPLASSGRRSKALATPLRYMAGRGIDRTTIAEAQIGCVLAEQHTPECPMCEGKTWCLIYNRIVIPVVDAAGVWQGWVGRHWDDAAAVVETGDVWDDLLGPTTPRRYGPRYLYPQNFPRAQVLWNMGALYEETDRPLLVVEGAFDGLPYWPDAVACLGKPVDGHIALLMQTKRPIVVALDGDAWQEGEMLALRLAFDGNRATFLRLPPKSDPGSVDAGQLWEEVIHVAATL
jgi:hypothetical protein